MPQSKLCFHSSGPAIAISLGPIQSPLKSMGIFPWTSADFGSGPQCPQVWSMVSAERNGTINAPICFACHKLANYCRNEGTCLAVFPCPRVTCMWSQALHNPLSTQQQGKPINFDIVLGSSSLTCNSPIKWHPSHSSGRIQSN